MKNEELLGVNARAIFSQCKNISAEILKIANESGYQEYQACRGNFDFDRCAVDTHGLRTELIYLKFNLRIWYEFWLTTCGQAYRAGYAKQVHVGGNRVWHEWHGGRDEPGIFLINLRGEK
ncbi:MAG: hypothetical protein ORN54_06880 [Cyclobacteriaceae bacterium]|nr:hypothetical protein [Cyclobacteriaceae bacterium]